MHDPQCAAVGPPPLVCVVKSVGNRSHDPDRNAQRQGTLLRRGRLDELGQRRPVHVLEQQVRPLGPRIVSEDGDDVGMTQALADAGLATKGGRKLRLCGGLGPHALHRDQPSGPQPSRDAGEIDVAHAPARDRPDALGVTDAVTRLQRARPSLAHPNPTIPSAVTRRSRRFREPTVRRSQWPSPGVSRGATARSPTS